MKLISHRGNINGKVDILENNPEHLKNVIASGYDVEVDVRIEKGELYLGHDKPQYRVDVDFLKKSSFWCHAKDIDTLYALINSDVHCFFHYRDDVTLTSRGVIWTYPGRKLTDKSVCVLPEIHNQNVQGCYGVCSDFILRY